MDNMLRNGTGPSNGQSLPDRLALYKQMDETRHEEFSNLAQAVITLEEKLRNARADLEDEQMTRRQYRRRAEEAESAAVSESFHLNIFHRAVAVPLAHPCNLFPRSCSLYHTYCPSLAVNLPWYSSMAMVTSSRMHSYKMLPSLVVQMRHLI